MPPKKKTSAKKSQATAPYCKCITNEGRRCSRKSVTDGYCKQHSKKCSYKSEEEYKASKSKKKTSGRKKKSGRTDSKPQLLAIEDKKPPQLLAIEDKKPARKPNPADFQVSNKARSIGGSSFYDALERAFGREKM